MSEATPQDVDIAVQAAQKAFDTVWGLNASGVERSKVLNKLADLMEIHADELAAIEALDVGGLKIHLFEVKSQLKGIHIGKTFGFARMIDIPGSIGAIRYYAGWADKLQGKTIEVTIILLRLCVHLLTGRHRLTKISLLTRAMNLSALLARSYPGISLVSHNLRFFMQLVTEIFKFLCLRGKSGQVSMLCLHAKHSTHFVVSSCDWEHRCTQAF